MAALSDKEWSLNVWNNIVVNNVNTGAVDPVEKKIVKYTHYSISRKKMVNKVVDFGIPVSTSDSITVLIALQISGSKRLNTPRFIDPKEAKVWHKSKTVSWLEVKSKPPTISTNWSLAFGVVWHNNTTQWRHSWKINTINCSSLMMVLIVKLQRNWDQNRVLKIV